MGVSGGSSLAGGIGGSCPGVAAEAGLLQRAVEATESTNTCNTSFKR